MSTPNILELIGDEHFEEEVKAKEREESDERSKKCLRKLQDIILLLDKSNELLLELVRFVRKKKIDGDGVEV